MSRAHISLKTKLAACVALMFLTHDESVALSEDQVLSLVQWDHWPIPHAEGGTDEHHNLRPMLIGGHREVTRKIDVPGIAKRKRVSRAQEEFRRLMLTPRADRPVKKSKWAKRPLSKKVRT